MHIALLSLSALAIFVAATSWLYLILAFALWMLVFGDDSTTFGYYALAIAVPLALMMVATFITAAIRWPFSQNVVIGSIAVAVILEVLFVVAVRS
jgi:hypothetical protein